MTCAICHRAARGYGYQDPAALHPPRYQACSMRCLSTIHKLIKAGKMFDLNHYEKQGLAAASQAAGDYLDEIGKTDLAAMSSAEWHDFIALIFVKATAEIQRLTETNAVPF